jgi:hypothetical protein
MVVHVASILSGWDFCRHLSMFFTPSTFNNPRIGELLLAHLPSHTFIFLSSIVVLYDSGASSLTRESCPLEPDSSDQYVYVVLLFQLLS